MVMPSPGNCTTVGLHGVNLKSKSHSPFSPERSTIGLLI